MSLFSIDNMTRYAAEVSKTIRDGLPLYNVVHVTVPDPKQASAPAVVAAEVKSMVGPFVDFHTAVCHAEMCMQQVVETVQAGIREWQQNEPLNPKNQNIELVMYKVKLLNRDNMSIWKEQNLFEVGYRFVYVDEINRRLDKGFQQFLLNPTSLWHLQPPPPGKTNPDEEKEKADEEEEEDEAVVTPSPTLLDLCLSKLNISKRTAKRYKSKTNMDALDKNDIVTVFAFAHKLVRAIVCDGGARMEECGKNKTFPYVACEKSYYAEREKKRVILGTCQSFLVMELQQPPKPPAAVFL